MRYLVIALTLTGCLKKLALGSVADALSGTGTTFSSDPDPEFVADAVPFALKTMEALMPQLPDHWELRQAACSGFTQYGYAFVLVPARLQTSLAIERAQSARAKGFLNRARHYCIEAIRIKSNKAPADFVKEAKKEDVPLLYWLAASTALAITSVKEQVDLMGEMPLVDALIKKAVALDPDWEKGTLQELVIAFDGGRSEAMGGSAKRARAAFKRAVDLSGGKRLGPYVSLAESVCVAEQNRKEFDALLKQALAIDLNASPDDRLANTLSRRRAERLLATGDDLILGD